MGDLHELPCLLLALRDHTPRVLQGLLQLLVGALEVLVANVAAVPSTGGLICLPAGVCEGLRLLCEEGLQGVRGAEALLQGADGGKDVGGLLAAFLKTLPCLARVGLL